MLAVGGVLLLGAGLLVLAGGFGLYGRLHLHPAGWWPLTSPHQPVVSTASRTRWTERGWWWPTVITVLSLAVVGALWWLVAQLRRSGPGTVTLPTPPGRGPALRLRGRALEDALETETVDLPEVTRVRVRLTGNRRRLLLRAAVRLGQGGTPAALLDEFHTGPLAHARTSLALPDLPCELRLQVAGHAAARAPKRPRVS
ncbi:alkaline shock response membrane anchor protein AmaP [Kitasatospora kazusensis]|uniref:Alkaline shock response membrane anchor protein AmaP n=2 Tax=Kitasatospora kazusensis TaxID=407974 RepID=A0ABP5LUL2_9ACTN